MLYGGVLHARHHTDGSSGAGYVKWNVATRIDTSKSERWFCSEAEAIAAGWRAPYRRR